MNIIIPTDTKTGSKTDSLFYRGQDLPKEVTRSILGYPCMSLLQNFCALEGVNTYVFGSARDRVLFQHEQATPLDASSVGDLDLVIPLAGENFSEFCTSFSYMVQTLGIEGIKLQIDAKNTLPQFHIMKGGRKIISVYGTFLENEGEPEELKVMKRLATSFLEVEKTAIFLPANGGNAYVISPWSNLSGGRIINEKSPQLQIGENLEYFKASLDLGRHLTRFNRFGGIDDYFISFMKRIYDQYKIMSGDAISDLYRKTDFFYVMGKRVTDFLSNYELLPNLINIEGQKVSWGNSIVPLVIIPALLVQFPFLDEYYCDLVGVPIYSSEKTGQAIELNSEEKIRTMNRLLFFNAFVNRLHDVGLGLRGISEYVGVAMGSAQIADRLMNLDPAENQRSDTTYWYVEGEESPTIPRNQRWKVPSPDGTFDSKFVAMGDKSYLVYSELLTIAGESLIGRNIDYFSPKGIFDVGLLKSLVDAVVTGYILSSSNLGMGVASD